MLSAPVPAWMARRLRLRCPACGEVDVRLARRWGLADYLLRAMGARPDRCRDCDRHFQAWPSLRALSPQVSSYRTQ